MAEKWYARFITWTFWRDLVKVKYWRHRSKVVEATKRYMVENGMSFVQARETAWAIELNEEYKEGKENWG